jgi:recombination protein RecA
MYGEGISKTGELIDLGVKAGVVEKSGSWYSYDSQRIGQGRENAKAFLKEHGEIAAAIEAAVRKSSGLISEKILTGEAGEDDVSDFDAAGAADGEDLQGSGAGT